MARARDIFATDFREEPYWWEAARPTTDLATDLPEKTDVLVVGSGYAGLSTALELARDGTDVTVVDAEALGWGASTRNGGMVSGGANVGKNANADPALMAEMLDEAYAAFEHFEGVIAREEIDCSYARVGRFVGAHCPSAYETQAKKIEALNEHADSGAYMVPRAEQHREIASDYYYGGMIVERAGGVHPARYHAGLLRAAHAAGVRLVAETRVGRIRGEAGSWTVETSQGPVGAKEVVIATNGYTGDATPALKRRLVPVASYIIATEDLGEDRVRALFPTGRVIADTKRVLYYYRPSPDGRRVIFGGRASFRTAGAIETAGKLHGFMTGVFPQLRGVRVSHAWNGNVAFSLDRLPHMGRQDGLHYALGCNGSGVVMMTHLGHRTALKLLGKTNRQSAFERLEMPASPFYGGTPWFLPFIGGLYHLQDWLDRRVWG